MKISKHHHASSKLKQQPYYITRVYRFFVLSFIVGCFNAGMRAQTNADTVTIGSHVWMTKNLAVDHYRNGDSIPEVKDPYTWRNLKTGAWCYYKNDPNNDAKYGKIYNWYAVHDPRGIAPRGWHVPSKEDFLNLKETTNDDANILKAVGVGSGSGAGTNLTGFSALLAGYRGYYGSFYYLEYDSYFWSSSEGTNAFASSIYLYSTGKYIFFYDFDKAYGFSVRCIKDK